MERELVGDSTSEKPERRSVREKETSLSSVPLAMSVATACEKSGASLTEKTWKELLTERSPPLPSEME